jgi:hypothetical protein
MQPLNGKHILWVISKRFIAFRHFFRWRFGCIERWAREIHSGHKSFLRSSIFSMEPIIPTLQTRLANQQRKAAVEHNGRSEEQILMLALKNVLNAEQTQETRSAARVLVKRLAREILLDY